ncbi:molybdopterin molybdotransferase MoeA [Pedobacter gandavensis]|uniref:Molybdopterin molybdenumtransferase n=1 Tax=Pedobacter gandavensis TaxID=2679963 RepID=A0ABR6ES63_9SPHI|nr:gephyrin-like molybdotransferase Glp [Pedobacter gandavensis]MBB2148042.1 molybdopterin molybdenumtransferase MoeA [Pedobacter gandavensis]
MITVTAAKTLISSHISPLDPTLVSLDKASGLILAQDIYAGCDIPAFKQSSMDGYAFRFTDLGKELILAGEMAAGTDQSFTLKEGEASRIFTGAPLPVAADTVVMQEKVTLSNGKIRFQGEHMQPGTNVRDQGAEIRSGELAMKKGTLLSPAAVGFLAGIGILHLQVFPLPRISIIVTGKELQQPGLALGFGQVYESNSYSLSSALKIEGITPINIFQADDELTVLTQVLEEALQISDVVLLTGGVSVGDYDFVLEASRNCAIKQVFHKVKQKPGKPLFFGKKGPKLIFGLPGNPSSVLSCYYNYVLPGIKQLSQQADSVSYIQAKLTKAYQKPAGLSHFLKGSYENGQVSPLNAQESFRLSSFALANCLICLEEAKEEFLTGETVTIMMLPQ